MTSQQLSELLQSPPVGGKKDGDAIVIPKGHATLFLNFAAGPLHIPRVQRVAAQGEFFCATTVRGEKYLFASDWVAAIKVEPAGEHVQRDGAPVGFGS